MLMKLPFFFWATGLTSRVLGFLSKEIAAAVSLMVRVLMKQGKAGAAGTTRTLIQFDLMANSQAPSGHLQGRAEPTGR